MFSGFRHLFAAHAALLFLLLTYHHTCCSARKTNNNHCIPSSCGNIHNISYPFRLKSDHENCGNRKYELECESNRTALYLSQVKYSVQAINYSNFTIRLVDGKVRQDDCSSIPHHHHPLYGGGFGHKLEKKYKLHNVSNGDDLFWTLIFITCPSPVRSPHFVDYSSSCRNLSGVSSSFHLKGYSITYVIVNGTISDLRDSCHIDLMLMTSLLQKDSTNYSYEMVRDSMVYGFELSWFPAYCERAIFDSRCNFDDDDDLDCSGKDLLGSCIVPILLALFVLCRVAMLFFWILGLMIIFYKWQRRHLSMYGLVEEFLRSNSDLVPIRYSYSEIKRVTKGFKDKLGEGGYGSVYKGKLRSGRFAAIKILGRQSKTNGQEFINEVATIGRIRHINVVQLIGFCAEGSNRALLYEFMPNGSLDKFIFSREGSIPLSDEKTYEVSLGVARGIEYLHQGCEMQILHFDIKPHNILLDKNFIPKISDFGLAKSYPTNNKTVPLTAARGTMGYIAPELLYKNLGGVSYKADVYSFGMLLMEMIGRRKNLNAYADHSSQIYFPSWVYDQVIEGKLDIEEIEDHASEQEKKTRKKMIIVALWCIQWKPSDRPSMHKVIEMLNTDVELLPIPPQPFFSPQEMKDETAMINLTELV